MNINTIFTVIGFVITCLIAGVVWQHHAEAKDEGKAVALALKENNKVISDALKESQGVLAEALKQIAEQQRRQNEIGREQTCILTLSPDRRTNAGDFCKRLSRERDR